MRRKQGPVPSWRPPLLQRTSELRIWANRTTAQREHVHEAIAGQEDADQGRDDRVSVANQDKGDGATKISDVEKLTRPRKPPDAGCTKLKMIHPGLLKTCLMVILGSVQNTASLDGLCGCQAQGCSSDA
jgi:hypothetical protein